MRAILLTPIAALALAAGGCGSSDDEGSALSGPTALPQGSEPVDLDPASFTTQIDNTYWPMKPGTRWTYTEIDEEGKRLEVVVTATSETEEIANGVEALVVRDTVTEDGELIEDTFDWYAQDEEGNVWYLGEDTAEFENGKLTTRSGSFEAGVDGAEAGVIMPAKPQNGMRYRQEYYEGEAEDSGEVLAVDHQVDAPYGHFDDALLTEDTNALEPKVLEYKLYGKGVGPVVTYGVSGGGGREELIDLEQVSEREAAEAGTAGLGEPYL